MLSEALAGIGFRVKFKREFKPNIPRFSHFGLHFCLFLTIMLKYLSDSAKSPTKSPFFTLFLQKQKMGFVGDDST
jgi:hypothetical protein